jgi:hypothetical protein
MLANEANIGSQTNYLPFITAARMWLTQADDIAKMDFNVPYHAFRIIARCFTLQAYVWV